MSTDLRQVRVLGAGASADDVAAVLAEDGCVSVAELVAPQVMDTIHAEMAPYIEATPMGPDDFSGHRTRRTGSMIARSPSFRPLAIHPLVTGTLDQVLGDHATIYQLHLTQVIDIGPGEPGQLVHRDQWAFDFFPFPSTSRVPRDNGRQNCREGRATPSSPAAQWTKLRPQYEGPVPAEMPRARFFTIGSVYRCGGEPSDERRLGINVRYARGCAGRLQYLACRQRERAIVAKLIGYRRGNVRWGLDLQIR
jgi:hypothetical protein